MILSSIFFIIWQILLLAMIILIFLGLLTVTEGLNNAEGEIKYLKDQVSELKGAVLENDIAIRKIKEKPVSYPSTETVRTLGDTLPYGKSYSVDDPINLRPPNKDGFMLYDNPDDYNEEQPSTQKASYID